MAFEYINTNLNQINSKYSVLSKIISNLAKITLGFATINQIRADKRAAIAKQISDSKSENEIWKVIANISKPYKEASITLIENGTEITDEKEVGNTLNNGTQLQQTLLMPPIYMEQKDWLKLTVEH